MDKLKKEIIGWMNYGIPRGKTIPIFEDLLDSLISLALSQRNKEILEFIDRNFLAYCRLQNARDDCKNCGLNRADLESFIRKIK